MKTAISLPNETFERVSQRATQLGMSRSEFFTSAAQRYLDDLDRASTTRDIDAALATLTDGDDDSAIAAVAAGRLVLDDGEEW